MHFPLQGWSQSPISWVLFFFPFFNCAFLGKWECLLMRFYLFMKNSLKSCKAPGVLRHIHNHDALVNCLTTDQLQTETLTLSSLQKLRQSGETVVVCPLSDKSAAGKGKNVRFSICTIVSSFIGVAGGINGREALGKDHTSPEKALLRELYRKIASAAKVVFCRKIEFAHTTEFLWLFSYKTPTLDPFTRLSKQQYFIFRSKEVGIENSEQNM